jgi:hypothetical protein
LAGAFFSGEGAIGASVGGASVGAAVLGGTAALLGAVFFSGAAVLGWGLSTTTS